MTIVRQFSDDLSLYCNSKRSKAAGTGAAFGFKFLWRALQAKLCWGLAKKIKKIWCERPRAFESVFISRLGGCGRSAMPVSERGPKPKIALSANAFDDFQSTGLTGYDVPSKNRTRREGVAEFLRFDADGGERGRLSRIWRLVASRVVGGCRVETLLGLGDFSEAFDLHDAPLSFGQFVINARLFIHPFFAIAALVLAARRYLRAAIVVLAAYILAALAIGWSPLGQMAAEFSGESLLAQQVIFGPLAVTAIVLAILDKHLRLLMAAPAIRNATASTR